MTTIAYERKETEEIVRHQLHDFLRVRLSPSVLKAVGQLIEKLPEELLISASLSPVLLVIPFSLLPLKKQLDAVRYMRAGDYGSLGNTAFTYLDENDLRDVEGFAEVPRDSPYVVTDIDRGESTKNLSPLAARDRLRAVGRNPVTVAQGVALAIHTPNLFHDTNIYLAGSEIKDRKTGEYFTPDLWVYADQIKMKRDRSDVSDNRWRTPSWKGIITL